MIADVLNAPVHGVNHNVNAPALGAAMRAEQAAAAHHIHIADASSQKVFRPQTSVEVSAAYRRLEEDYFSEILHETSESAQAHKKQKGV